MLIPSTITALRTRRYTSTLYIHHTIHGFGYNPMNDGGWYSIQSPFLSNLPPAWSTLPPPITLNYDSPHHEVVNGLMVEIPAKQLRGFHPQRPPHSAPTGHELDR